MQDLTTSIGSISQVHDEDMAGEPVSDKYQSQDDVSTVQNIGDSKPNQERWLKQQIPTFAWSNFQHAG